MKNNFKDITGQRFNSLTVTSFAYCDERGEAHWNCICDCGKQTTTTGHRLRSGKTKSCGCLQSRIRKEGIHKSHGMTSTKLYVIWSNMKARCYNPKNTMYKNYGGRGISVCDEWKNSFEDFSEWALKNGYVEGLSIERINVDDGYNPNNCTWITLKEQSLNQRRSHRLTAFGRTQTIKEWSEESGIKYDTIERRINQYGWSAEDAVTIKEHGKRTS